MRKFTGIVILLATAIGAIAGVHEVLLFIPMCGGAVLTIEG